MWQYARIKTREDWGQRLLIWKKAIIYPQSSTLIRGNLNHELNGPKGPIGSGQSGGRGIWPSLSQKAAGTAPHMWMEGLFFNLSLPWWGHTCLTAMFNTQPFTYKVKGCALEEAASIRTPHQGRGGVKKALLPSLARLVPYSLLQRMVMHCHALEEATAASTVKGEVWNPSCLQWWGYCLWAASNGR